MLVQTHAPRKEGTKERKNKVALTTTIDGPEGASISTERKMPRITEKIPIKVHII